MTDTPIRLPATGALKELQKAEQAVLAAQPLYKIKAVFPFDLFPEELILDHHKIDVVYHYFFGSKELRSIPLKEVATISVMTTPFFATMHIADRLPMNNVVEIKYLPIEPALRFKKLAQGLIVGLNQKIDFTKLPDAETRVMAEELGGTEV